VEGSKARAEYSVTPTAVEKQVSRTVMIVAQHKGKSGNYCHKRNHFSRICMARNQQIHSDTLNSQDHSVRFMRAPSEDDHGESYVFNCTDRPLGIDTITVNIDVPVKMVVDYGASVNLLDRNTYHRLCQNSHHCTLSKSATTIFTCGSKTPLPIQ